MLKHENERIYRIIEGKIEGERDRERSSGGHISNNKINHK